jgi:hypothetical protein
LERMGAMIGDASGCRTAAGHAILTRDVSP